MSLISRACQRCNKEYLVETAEFGRCRTCMTPSELEALKLAIREPDGLPDVQPIAVAGDVQAIQEDG